MLHEEKNNILDEAKETAMNESSEVRKEQTKWQAKILPGVKKIVTRRNLIVACSVLLIGCAVYLNWLFFRDEVPLDTPTSGGKTVIDYNDNTQEDDGGSYFSVTQINRQRARDEAVEVYQTVVENEDALDDLKAEAIEGIARIADNIEAESNIETLVKAKGFTECVAVVSENFANIIVSSDGLLPNQVVQIKEIVCDQTGIVPDNVKIIEVSNS